MPVTPSRSQTHAGTTPTYYIQHAPISIQAAKLNTRSFKKIEPLNQGKNNWPDWSFAIKIVLNQHLVGGYLTGNIIAPYPLTEPGAHNNWSLNNIAVVSALYLCVSHEDQCLLKDVTNAATAWNTLRKRHEEIGPIMQMLLIQGVFAKCYSCGQHFSLTSTDSVNSSAAYTGSASLLRKFFSLLQCSMLSLANLMQSRLKSCPYFLPARLRTPSHLRTSAL
ncbi:hypothetical protein PAXINDRAFT_10128 [Paxillus involutus ATCC 200175]|nr:hypothetical protein PAXINDRAFT_10128 [Paxillus involutus ATCC 200175]